MGSLVVITPAKIYMDVLVTCAGMFCVVRPNMVLNDRKFTNTDVAFAHRYVVQEGWVEYANGTWEPDPELSTFLNEMIEAGT